MVEQPIADRRGAMDDLLRLLLGSQKSLKPGFDLGSLGVVSVASAFGALGV